MENEWIVVDRYSNEVWPCTTEEEANNTAFYHEYREAVEHVFRMLPENATVTVPFEFAVALGRLRDVHVEAVGDNEI